MKAYAIKGLFLMKNIWQSFNKEVVGENKEAAKERILSTMGGRHKIKRKMIKIETITEVSLADIKDPLVKYIVEGRQEFIEQSTKKTGVTKTTKTVSVDAEKVEKAEKKGKETDKKIKKKKETTKKTATKKTTKKN